MDIRHKVDKARIITDVTWDARQSAWIKSVADMVEFYAPRFWEEADIDQWQPIAVSAVRDGTALMDRTSHIAGILNTDYRFVMLAGSVVVEKRI